MEPIKIFEGDILDAYESALASSAPVVVRLQVFMDDRGWSLMNQLQGVMSEHGQVNYSMMYPHVIKAWHLHEHQTDFLICVMGHAKIGVCDTHRAWSTVVDKMSCVVIPPKLWHGVATVGDRVCGVLYYVTKKFDAKQPDELRKPFDFFEFDWEMRSR